MQGEKEDRGTGGGGSRGSWEEHNFPNLHLDLPPPVCMDSYM